MEAEWFAERAALRYLARQHPEWAQAELAATLGRSRTWVAKWLARLNAAAPDDLTVLHARSCARHTPPPSLPQGVVERILALRDEPPDHLRRVPGPRALLYYLAKDPQAQALGVPLPRSTRTIWKVLRAHGRIACDLPRRRQPLVRPAPLEEVQMDFKDVSSVPADPTGKQQHVVEVLNFVDAGTSSLLSAQVSADYHAQTAFDAVVAFLQQWGLPKKLTFDHDPRWVGGSSGRDFPSALVRFLLCLGVEPNLCPPRQPQKNPYVERYHRSFGKECLEVLRPGSEEEVREVTAAFFAHYNTERPNQALSCGNRPPWVAFPALPKLPPLPAVVDPDRWLAQMDGQAFARRVLPNGTVEVARRSYYIQQALAGQSVVLVVNAPERVFEVLLGKERLKRLPIKGVVGQTLPFAQYVMRMREEARSEYRRWLRHQGRWRQGTLWAS
jgi:integrase-like protein